MTFLKPGVKGARFGALTIELWRELRLQTKGTICTGMASELASKALEFRSKTALS